MITIMKIGLGPTHDMYDGNNGIWALGHGKGKILVLMCWCSLFHYCTCFVVFAIFRNKIDLEAYSTQLHRMPFLILLTKERESPY